MKKSVMTKVLALAVATTMVFSLAACSGSSKKDKDDSDDEDIDVNIKDPADQPEAVLIQSETKRELFSALEKIDPQYRQVLYLMFFENLKPEQISKVIKKSVKQTYNLSARGKASLRKELERMGSSWETWDM